MKYKIPYWLVMVNSGDGGAYVRFFSSKEKAEAYYELESEPFCDAIFPPGTVEIDPEHY